MVKQLFFLDSKDEDSYIVVGILITIYLLLLAFSVVRYIKPIYTYYKDQFYFGIVILTIILISRLALFALYMIPSEHNALLSDIFFVLPFSLYIAGYCAYLYVYFDFYYYLTTPNENEISKRLTKAKKFIFFIYFFNLFFMVFVLILYEIKIFQEFEFIFTFYAELTLIKLVWGIVFLALSDKIRKNLYSKFDYQFSLKILEKIRFHTILALVSLFIETFLCNICLFYIYYTNNVLVR